jgi:translocation protein SEC72
LFKVGQAQQAVLRYTTAATLAIQRPPWEANQFMREELSTTVSNRSAAYFEAHDFVAALADAETVIAIRRNWPKGHYRKAKALVGMGRHKEAADAVKLGLSYEPSNAVRLLVNFPYVVFLKVDQELGSFLADIEKTVAASS